jgi:hypothetical protein
MIIEDQAKHMSLKKQWHLDEFWEMKLYCGHIKSEGRPSPFL